GPGGAVVDRRPAGPGSGPGGRAGRPGRVAGETRLGREGHGHTTARARGSAGPGGLHPAGLPGGVRPDAGAAARMNQNIRMSEKMRDNGTIMTSQPQVLPGHAPDAGSRPKLSFAVPRRGKPPQHLADLDLQARQDVLAEMGHPGYRAKQLSTHYFSHLTREAEQMTDIPAAARTEMADLVLPDLLREHRRLTADDGATVKTLWSLFDDVKVESVLMGYQDRATLCVSSEAGCGMACPFCATGQGGLTRNLSTAEIIEQVRRAAAFCRDGELAGAPRLTNVVFMGMGEPLANYKAVISAVKRMVSPAPDGFGM